MFALCPDLEFRWSEIRDHLWLVMKIPPQYNENTFNVKLQRSLNKLVKGGFLRRLVRGHQNTSYVLDKKGLERAMANYCPDPPVSYTLVGAYKRGDSYEDFKKKAMKRLEQLFERDLRKSYEEARKYDENSMKSHEKDM